MRAAFCVHRFGMILTAVCFCARVSSAMVFPGADWQTATPESQGVDSAKLDAAVSNLQSNSGVDGVRELVIIRNGYMIRNGNNIDKQHGIWSATKSFTSTVLGLLIDDGKCTLNTLAKDYLSSMAATYPTVNLKHFTTMTSGYVAVGDIPATGYTHGPSSTWWDPDSSPLFTPPGSKYAYWDSAMNQFANALTQIAGEPIEDLFKRRIADPIQMDRAKWDWGDFGTIGGYVVNGGSGNGSKHIFISARQMARFGHLFLNRGNWDGTQLVSTSWVDAVGSVQVPASTPLGDPVRSAIYGPGVYSYNWWVNGVKSGGERKWPGMPTSTYAASGYNNNDMFVIPDWNMVIVRLGLDQGDFLMTDAVYGTFLNKVGEAITGGAVNPPVITSPASGADLVEGSTVSLEGTGDGTLSWSYDANSDGLGEIDIGTGSPCSFVVPTGTADPRTITIFLAGDGVRASVDCNIVSGGNRPPSASLTASPASGAPPLAVSFDAGSSDPDGDALAHEWDFDYDGATFTVDDSTGATATAGYTYDTAGTYTAAVRVSDGTESVTDTATITVTVAGAITIECEDMTLVDYNVEAADGYIAIDYQNEITGTATAIFSGDAGRYRIEVIIVKEDDGLPTLDVYVAGALVDTISYTLGSSARDPQTVDLGEVDIASGDEIKLVGTMQGGAAARVDKIILTPVGSSGNSAPTVDLSATPTSGSAPLTVSFDAGSSDPDGDPLTHEWDFDYDGTTFAADETTGATATASHIYDTEATYAAAVRVSDGNGHVVIDTVTVTVSAVTDSDGDGLPDSWEVQYFGDVTSQGKDDDYDGDGYSNYREYLAGTDPTNANDYPAPDGGGSSGCAPVGSSGPPGGFVGLVLAIAVFVTRRRARVSLDRVWSASCSRR